MFFWFEENEWKEKKRVGALKATICNGWCKKLKEREKKRDRS
jgi:hypothetical protein